MSDSVLNLLRDKLVTEGTTMGRLMADGLAEIQTVELPWKNNHPMTSCIPTGTYELRMTKSARFLGMMPEIMNVYGRTGIRLHPGVRVENVEGCAAIGEMRVTPITLGGQVPAFGRLYAWLTETFKSGRVLVDIRYADGSVTP